MKGFRLFTIICLVASLSGCAGAKSARGFSLPDGDAEKGKATFVRLQCHACHSVSGVELPDLDSTREKSIMLGGTVSRIKTYGELVTSIINPSHKIAKSYLEGVEENGKSTMKNYNDALTVSQLIDLVAFLQSHYELEPFDPTDYPML